MTTKTKKTKTALSPERQRDRNLRVARHYTADPCSSSAPSSLLCLCFPLFYFPSFPSNGAILNCCGPVDHAWVLSTCHTEYALHWSNVFLTSIG